MYPRIKIGQTVQGYLRSHLTQIQEERNSGMLVATVFERLKDEAGIEITLDSFKVLLSRAARTSKIKTPPVAASVAKPPSTTSVLVPSKDGEVDLDQVFIKRK